MKRFLIWCMVCLMFVSFVGCKRVQKADEEMATLDTRVEETVSQTESDKLNQEPKPSKEPVAKKNNQAERNESLQESRPPEDPSQLIAGEQPDFEGAVMEKVEDEMVIHFPDQDFSKWYEYEEQLVEYSTKHENSYSNLMERIGEDGLIVAAKAYGEREGHRRGCFVYTWTNVRIEKVFYGTALANEIRVKEWYCPVSSNGKNYIACMNKYSRLKDGELMLLFLRKLTSKEGYELVYYQLPLQEGYQNYSEEYLTELLDFYRGDRSVYKGGGRRESEDSHRYEEINGVPTQVLTTTGVDVWPEKNLSNEEMLAELSDNILVQVAANHKVCLWPVGHIKYQYIEYYYGAEWGFDKWCTPPKNY